MIELLSKDRCISCNQCVSVCPTNVFDATEDGIPVIARKSDCQSCFMCELYCPVDALFVTPLADENVDIEETAVAEQGWLGSYREQLGWGKGRTLTVSEDASYYIFRKAHEDH
ncbi:ferredoxin family protein [Paenibacillus sp. N3.4]|uniref:4Fe-4S dicluster domain-containing protein n=1 Tax=Paenibacillus sp. N3.4 TaxID=2603222 RepID=UPI0011CB4B38|nr:ferredoxin family protein [Paenibacillus sp. N3.4]TXK83879.1 ferredoxin family protein [Paenibacillus sp. N3.4]